MKQLASFFFITLLICGSSYSQTIPVGSPFQEENWRRMQLKGVKDVSTSFTIRPLYRKELTEKLLDSSAYALDSSLRLSKENAVLLQKKYGESSLLPITFKQQYSSHHPYGWNDGSIIPAKGYQSQLSFGVYSRIGPLHIQIQPEVTFADNKSFTTFPLTRDEYVSKIYYTTVLNYTDAPELFGKGNYTKLFSGQSSAKVEYKKLALGVSTENLWWGPGIRNSLLMSNNAPGFAHITFNTVAPIISPIGSFEWQLISGLLKGSGIVPNDTSHAFNDVKLYEDKRPENRYINGMVATWQPKWTKGLYLGFARVFYLYKSDVPSSFDGYLPVIGHIFKDNTENEDAKSRDQMLSAFFRIVLPKEKAELYGEIGRNDHSSDSRDFSQEPEHSSAYVIGFNKMFNLNKSSELELMAEFTNLQVPMTILLREQSNWYTHYQVRHGYTNQGQIIGAGIGTGGKSQTLALNWIQEMKKLGVSFERVVRNNDFYYHAFTPLRNYSSHWVDLSVNLNAGWQYKRLIYTANISRVKSLNYQWVQRTDVKNWHAQLSASYLF